jgi:tight adherence protein C
MMLISLACFAVGCLLPEFWLYNRIKERQRAILNTLPDVLDLLMVCVEAGLASIRRWPAWPSRRS